MGEVSMATPILDGFELRNPFWVASAHFSDSRAAIQNWKHYAPAALTLKTTADKSRLTEVSQEKSRVLVPLETHKDPILREVRKDLSLNFFSDGPKTIELLSLSDTRELLTFAKSTLKDSKVGVSILMGEDYDAAAQLQNGCGSNLSTQILVIQAALLHVPVPST